MKRSVPMSDRLPKPPKGWKLEIMNDLLGEFDTYWTGDEGTIRISSSIWRRVHTDHDLTTAMQEAMIEAQALPTHWVRREIGGANLAPVSVVEILKDEISTLVATVTTAGPEHAPALLARYHALRDQLATLQNSVYEAEGMLDSVGVALNAHRRSADAEAAV